MAPKKVEHEMDMERQMLPDSRDPRTQTTTWPCFNQHVAGKDPGKQVREVAQLHSVRTSDALHSLQGSTLQQHFDDQPGQHEQGPQGAEGDDAKRAKAQRRTGQGDSREGDCRRTSSCSPGQLQDRPQEEPGEDRQGEGEVNTDFDNAEFRRLCRGGAPVLKSVTQQLDGTSSRTCCSSRDQSHGLSHRERVPKRVMELVTERMASQATASRVPVPDDVELEPAYDEPSLA